MDAIKLYSIPNPKWFGNPESGNDTGITGVVVTKPGANIICTLTALNEGMRVSRTVAMNATTGDVIQASEISEGNAITLADGNAGMVYADGFTVTLLIIFVDGTITVVKATH